MGGFKFTKSQRNLICGMGTVLGIAPPSIWGRLPQFNRTDLDALRGDWEKVGNDLRTVMNVTLLPAVEQSEAK